MGTIFYSDKFSNSSAGRLDGIITQLSGLPGHDTTFTEYYPPGVRSQLRPTSAITKDVAAGQMYACFLYSALCQALYPILSFSPPALLYS